MKLDGFGHSLRRGLAIWPIDAQATKIHDRVVFVARECQQPVDQDFRASSRSLVGVVKRRSVNDVTTRKISASLVFLAEEAVFSEPTERAVDTPSVWQNDESFHIVGSFDYFNGDSWFGFDVVDDFPLVDSEARSFF